MRLEVRRALYSARELVEVAIVEACLEALHVALRLDHPTLGDHAALGDPPTLRRARCVNRRARELQTAIRAYRRAVQAASDEYTDHLPF